MVVLRLTRLAGIIGIRFVLIVRLDSCVVAMPM